MNELRVLALLEANSITGTAKAVLEMSLEAQADAGGQRRISLHVANFARGQAEPSRTLTNALAAAGVPLSWIRERGRFDSSVLPQIQNLAKECDAQVVWTNSVKSHFLVHQARVQKGRKWVAFHHGYTASDLKMRVYNQLDRVSLRHADRVLTVCIPFAAEMEKRGVARRNIRVQHMPIRPFVNSEEDAAELRAALAIPPDAPVVLSVGRLSKEKGHADLLAAFGRLTDLRSYLVLVGDGGERRNLEQTARDFGTNVIFAGHRDDAKRFYGIANVFALPSFTEGTPNVLLEAMAAGVPVVATNVGGIPELASDGRHALLVGPHDPAALADALRKVLESAELRNELVGGGKQIVAGHTPRSYFRAMREIFLEVAAE